MDVIILCGGKGTRLSEETIDKPKPMVEIGGYPMLWHIMKLYSSFGLNEFITGNVDCYITLMKKIISILLITEIIE